MSKKIEALASAAALAAKNGRPEVAVELAHQCATEGHFPSMINYARAKMLGWATDQNFADAKFWFEQAVKAADSESAKDKAERLLAAFHEIMIS